MTKNDVNQKLSFAERRYDDLRSLIARGEFDADEPERQNLIQEFFFHLIGAADRVAQLANSSRGLGMDVEDVRIPTVAKALAGDPLEPALNRLYVSVRGQSLPNDPYSPEGLLFRLYNYRHQVTHRARNPFSFQIAIGGPERANLHLDPRGKGLGASAKNVQTDLLDMLELMRRKCEDAMNLL